MSLAVHHRIIISVRSLRRYLANMRLYRRKNYSDILYVALFIIEQVEKSGQLHGYKLLHLKCIQHGFVVNQENVRFLLSLIDPDGVKIRQRNRLQRRQYSCNGPDYTWHVDSYDKLKPYGFCINGCIDGFSRRIIWMEVYTSNSDPALIASYYLDSVKLRKGCPKRLRLDRGTENTYIAQMQMFLRFEHEVDDLTICAIFGSSNHNQRIESWWGFLRKQCCQFWMNTFQTMKDDTEFNGGFIDKNILQFCFMQMIQVCSCKNCVLYSISSVLNLVCFTAKSNCLLVWITCICRLVNRIHNNMTEVRCAKIKFMIAQVNLMATDLLFILFLLNMKY